MEKTIFAALAITMSLLSLTSCNDDELEVSDANILGTWVEDYSDYPYFASESRLTWSFGNDGYAAIHIYDVFAGDSDYTKTYRIGLFGENVISFNHVMSDYSSEDYTIKKLTKNEMEWQRVGTTFSKGTVGSDFRHFVRSESVAQ